MPNTNYYLLCVADVDVEWREARRLRLEARRDLWYS